MEIDPTIPPLPMKDVVCYSLKIISNQKVFRIYRDVRFSNDKTLYKVKISETVGLIQVYFAAGWSRTGRKGPYAKYYVHIQPNGGTILGYTVL